MKKLFTLLFAVCVALAASASDPFRLKLDNPANVQVDIEGTLQSGLVEGMNYFDIPAGTPVRVIAASTSVLITSVVQYDEYFDEDYDVTYKVDVLPDGRQYVDLASRYPEDEYFVISTSGTVDARSARCTVYVDDPDAVELKRGGSQSVVSLVAGLNIVSFDPNTESDFTLVPTGDKAPYKVTLDDEVVTASYTYNLKMENGSVLDIQVRYPDMDCTITMNVTGYKADQFLTNVFADGTPVQGWESGTFTVKAGVGLSLRADTNNYEVLSCKVNNQDVAFSNPFNILVEGDMTFDIEVQQYAVFPVTINIDDVSRVTVYRGYSNNGDVLTLANGTNEVEINRNYPFITVVNDYPGYMSGCSFGPYTLTPSELKGQTLQIGYLADGNVVDITTSVLEQNNTGIVFVHGSELGAIAWSDDIGMPLAALNEGYNEFKFDAWQNSFNFDARFDTNSWCYINGEAYDQTYPDSRLYSADLADNDVVKFFIGEKPATYTVSVTVASELEGKVAVTTDKITTRSESEFSVLAYTELTIATEAEAEILVNGEPYAGPLTITADTEITVKLFDGISDVAADTESNGPVYNMQGIRVADSLDGAKLPAGLYICGGRKVRVL